MTVMSRLPAPASHNGVLVALMVSIFVVLVAMVAAALVVAGRRAQRSPGFGPGSALDWRHHLGCSLADNGTDSATLFLASDLCISINHRDDGPADDLPAAVEASAPAPEPATVPELGEVDDAARLEILLLERLWEISSGAEDVGH